MRSVIRPRSIEDYDRFLKIKRLPRRTFSGYGAEFPDEYASKVGLAPPSVLSDTKYIPKSWLFDYQRDIAALAIRKQKFCVFADCGLGKTLIFTEFARHASLALPVHRRILIVSPLMVVHQTINETKRFYGDELALTQVSAAGLPAWLRGETEGRIGITNYQAIRDGIEPGSLGCLILDESSMLKSHYGKWGTGCIELGRGVQFKLALTGTPAPNDRTEYANHGLFVDAYPTVNAFLAKYFFNRGETSNRWELKSHSVEAFYRDLSDWSIFLSNPATYGWKDNTDTIPPINVHIHDVELTSEQSRITQEVTGELIPTGAGGIVSRNGLAQIAKGSHKGVKVETNKPGYIKGLVNSWPDESTIIWCRFDNEQDSMEATFPEAGSIRGSTPHEERESLIEKFQRGEIRVLISKAKVLGFGLNLQIATRQVFSGLQDSYEEYWQAVKRSNRYGSTKPLNVHIPVTEIERPMIESVLMKAKRIQSDSDDQERRYRNASA